MTDLGNRAWTMRRMPTPAEARLWQLLRTPPLKAWHFRRQAAFPPCYIADFASHRAQLVIEADGASHDLTATEDAARTDWFATQGYRVLRYANAVILADGQSVWRDICSQLPEEKPTRRR